MTEPVQEGPSLAAVPVVTSYVLDRHNRIVELGGAWDEFALANQGERVTRSFVLGRVLDSFVSGDTTRMFLYTLLTNVRKLNHCIVRPYRCDSPEIRRQLEMTLMPEGEGYVRLEHRLLQEIPVQHALYFDRQQLSSGHVAGTTDSSYRFIRRCSMCCHFWFEGQWLELEQLQTAPQLQYAGKIPVIHTVCPGCKSALHDRKRGGTHMEAYKVVPQRY